MRQICVITGGGSGMGLGYAGEIAFLLSSIVDSRNGYLTGEDIVCDGGLVASGVNPMHT